MDWQTVVLIIAGFAFVAFLGFLAFLNMAKKAATKAFSGAVDKALDKTSEVISEKVLTPTMSVASEGMQKGLGAVGAAVKQSYEEGLRNDPKRIEIEVTKFAERSYGLVTEASVVAELNLTAYQAKGALKKLERTGVCHSETQDQVTTYVFESFLKRVEIWECGHCGNVLRQEPEENQCPSCGALLERKTIVER